MDSLLSGGWPGQPVSTSGSQPLPTDPTTSIGGSLYSPFGVGLGIDSLQVCGNPRSRNKIPLFMNHLSLSLTHHLFGYSNNHTQWVWAGQCHNWVVEVYIACLIILPHPRWAHGRRRFRRLLPQAPTMSSKLGRNLHGFLTNNNSNKGNLHKCMQVVPPSTARVQIRPGALLDFGVLSHMRPLEVMAPIFCTPTLVVDCSGERLARARQTLTAESPEMAITTRSMVRCSACALQNLVNTLV
jgi:hypothetical protein